jgi:hypothetical protein
VNVITGVVWRVKLNNPVDLGDVQTPGSNVRAHEDPRRCIFKFKKRGGALLLFLFPLRHVGIVENMIDITETYMKLQNGNVNVVEQFSVVLDGVAAREEHDDFLLPIF